MFQLVRASIQLYQFITSDEGNTILARKIKDNNCSYGECSSCTRSQSFYCTDTQRCLLYSAKLNQTIPDLVVSCLPVDSLLLSTLQCFYNASCIQMLLQWRSFELVNITIDPRVGSVIPPDPLIISRFSSDTKVENIVSQLFTEDWTNTINFSSYYRQCSPSECTYTYEQRFNQAYIIATIFGIVCVCIGKYDNGYIVDGMS